METAHSNWLVTVDGRRVEVRFNVFARGATDDEQSTFILHQGMGMQDREMIALARSQGVNYVLAGSRRGEEQGPNRSATNGAIMHLHPNALRGSGKPNTGAHETGHLLGLGEHYRGTAMRSDPHYENNVMANTYYDFGVEFVGGQWTRNDDRMWLSWHQGRAIAQEALNALNRTPEQEADWRAVNEESTTTRIFGPTTNGAIFWQTQEEIDEAEAASSSGCSGCGGGTAASSGGD